MVSYIYITILLSYFLPEKFFLIRINSHYQVTLMIIAYVHVEIKFKFAYIAKNFAYVIN